MQHPDHPESPEVPEAPDTPKPAPPDPERVNHGTGPGDSFGERWTNKVHSTPDPNPGRIQEQPIEGGKHHEPTPFTRG